MFAIKKGNVEKRVLMWILASTPAPVTHLLSHISKEVIQLLATETHFSSFSPFLAK